MLLDHAGQRPGPHLIVIALLGQPAGGGVRQLDVDLAFGQLRLQLDDELLHDLAHHRHVQMAERDDGVQPVAELRREQAVDGLLVVALALGAGEAIGRLGQIGRPGVGGHDQDHVAEIHLLAVVVGQLAVIHHLQQDVEQIGMRLLDLVQQQHRVRVLVDGISQQPALIEPDVARRRADQPRDGMALHVFRHVEADQLHPQRRGQLSRHLRLAHARGPGEQIGADGLLRLAQTGAGQLDGGAQGLDGRILAEYHAGQLVLQVLQHLRVIARDGLRRDARHGGDGCLDVLHADGLLALRFGQQHLRGAGFVDHVDGLVRQLAIAHVARRELHRRADGLGRVAHVVVLLEIGLQAFEDLHRVGHRRLVNVDLLKAPDQRAVLLEVLAVFLVGGGADAAQAALRQCGLEQIGGVHRPAGGGPGPDHGVDLVDEQDGAGIVLNLLDDRLDALLEVAAIAGAGQQHPHVELEDGGVGQHVGHLALGDALGQPLGDRRLADPGIAHQQRVVLLPPAQHLNGALHLLLAADQRIDAPRSGLVVQVDAPVVQRLGLRLLVFRVFLFLVGLHVVVIVVILERHARQAGDVHLVLAAVHPQHRPGPRRAGALGDAVRDVVDGVIAGHVLFLQEPRGMGFTLRENGHQHVGAGHLLAPRRLHMDDGALDHPLKGGGRPRVLAIVHHQAGQLVLQILHQLAAQQVEIDVAGAHHRGGVGVVDQRQQQMLQRGVFVAVVIGHRQRPVQSLFQRAGKRRHDYSFSITHCRGCSWRRARSIT